MASDKHLASGRWDLGSSPSRTHLKELIMIYNLRCHLMDFCLTLALKLNPAKDKDMANRLIYRIQRREWGRKIHG